jgi:hypothetical protein
MTLLQKGMKHKNESAGLSNDLEMSGVPENHRFQYPPPCSIWVNKRNKVSLI